MTWRIGTVIAVLALLSWPSAASAQDEDCLRPPLGFSVNYGVNELTFEWDNPTDGCDADSYELQAGRTAGASDLGVVRLPGTLRAFRVYPPRGLQFFARLIAFHGFERSLPTPDLVVTVDGGCGIPGPPTNVTAAPSFLGGTGAFDITWTAPVAGPPPAGCPPAGYAIAIGTATGAQDVTYVEIPDNGTRTYTTRVLPNGSYFARVYSLTRAGRSVASNEATFAVPTLTLPFPPSPPVNFSAVLDDGVVVLRWDVPFIGAAQFHRLQVGRAPGETIPPKIDLGAMRPPVRLAPAPGLSGVFYLRLEAYNDTGATSLPSNEVRIVLPFPR